MDDIVTGCKKYVAEVLAHKTELSGYIGESTILLNVYENNKIWDLMILIGNDCFKHEFARLYGEYFVVDDHEHDPLVFTRVKSYQWLAENFTKRLPVALWIFQNAIILQEKGNLFQRVIAEQRGNFCRDLHGIIKRKYIELRTDRHNLRYSAMKPEDMANALLKANIAKLCFELCLLAGNKPYPPKNLLPDYAKNNAINGNEVFFLAQKFLTAADPETTILLSDKLIDHIVATLRETKFYSDELLLKWWMYLD